MLAELRNINIYGEDTNLSRQNKRTPPFLMQRFNMRLVSVDLEIFVQKDF